MTSIELERPIEELRSQIQNLRKVGNSAEINIGSEIERLEKQLEKVTERVFSNLSPWDITQIARHPLRPGTLDYLQLCCPDFEELHGDRHYGDDRALVGGIGTLAGRSVMFLGHNKGKEVEDKVTNNFGMPHPEGYRKALRLMKLAERFNMPICTFIDTPGAYPGIAAENHNQSEAIAVNLMELSRLTTPVICLVTGEGGSGGALAIGVGDHLMMLQYAIYSVISPEGCASILWRKAEYAAQAANAMQVTAAQLLELGAIDQVLEEPLGGAHRNPAEMVKTVEQAFAEQLDRLTSMDTATLLESRSKRFRNFGLV